MPELPDVTIYVEALAERLIGQMLRRARVLSPFLLRTFEPPLEAAEGRVVESVQRIGKRIALSLSGDLHLLFHLLIAGRFRLLDVGKKPPGRIALAIFEFPAKTLLLTEAAQQKRAALYVLSEAAALRQHDPGGLDVLRCSPDAFAAALRRENHTLKRSLTDPQSFDGIGNAYSDEILHAARLSPLALTQKLADAEIARLHAATKSTLEHWIAALRIEFTGRFPGPGEITAFRPGFAVHGKFGQPCPDCGTKVARIRYAANETNYCPKCQTGGRLLADRSLSRLLKNDWPRLAE